jgi:membrane-bound transcription factor site-1 protease
MYKHVNDIARVFQHLLYTDRNATACFVPVQGKLSLANAKKVLDARSLRASVVPAALDLTDCPYMWPYCLQPLYATAQPIIFNATVLNGLGVYGEFSKPPTWTPTDEGGALLDVVLTRSDALWPWSGHVSLFISVKDAGAAYSGGAHGRIDFEVTSPPRRGEKARPSGHVPFCTHHAASLVRMSDGHHSAVSRCAHTCHRHCHRSLIQAGETHRESLCEPTMQAPRTWAVSMPVTARIVPTPPRASRVLWDQFHSVKYPPAYLPRDNLDIRSDILDWHGDHLLTNFHTLYTFLRSNDVYVETLASPYTCFNASRYGALIVADSEEEFYPEEVTKLADVRSSVVFSRSCSISTS